MIALQAMKAAVASKKQLNFFLKAFVMARAFETPSIAKPRERISKYSTRA